MSISYSAFKESGIDLSPLGLLPGEAAGYYCTPKGAQIFGWGGVDGIHFCFVRGFGETVFAVSPDNGATDCVHPVAHSFEEFLRLLLACRDTAALEQAWMMDEQQFRLYAEQIEESEAGKTALAALRDRLGLAPAEHPWQIMKELRDSFEPGRLPFKKEYYELTAQPRQRLKPEWKVFFDGDFWGHHGRRRAGRPIAVAQAFTWAGESWQVPAVYCCAEGLVIDLIKETPPEQMRAFVKKWELEPEQDGKLPGDVGEQIERENPLSIRFTALAEVNGRTLMSSGGCAVSWNSLFPDINGEESQEVVGHYALDPASCWTVWRVRFKWKKRPGEIRSLKLLLGTDREPLPGIVFTVRDVGDKIVFRHPITGHAHTLTVESLTEEIVDLPVADKRYTYPSHLVSMGFSLSPELPHDAVRVTDALPGDRPLEKKRGTVTEHAVLPAEDGQPNGQEHAMAQAAAVGMIGSRDGPMAVFVSAHSQAAPHTACSSLRFAPVRENAWRFSFCERPKESVIVSLLPVDFTENSIR